MDVEMQNPMAESQMKLVVEGRRQMVYEGLIADSVVTAGTLWDTYEIRAEEAQASWATPAELPLPAATA